ncbi:hypothetical protein Clacol_003519 [Clathrus columnatus]|uniref:Uncharacterized protein n=1 Tax=Clathrus columnatus TaxID=1419009 RepID=A0AAV5A714_9AGAM|nr:hypothetical protein Clacol_003519 [Clathrus columnatus]
MSLLSIALTSILLATSVFSAETTNATCSDDQWTITDGVSPCELAVELEGACFNDAFNLPALPVNKIYDGPTQGTSNTCQCSSVTYSVVQACAACQGRSFAPASFPGQPASTLSPTSTSTGSTSSPSGSNTSAAATSSKSSNHTGAIVGGVIGGLVAVALIIVGVFIVMRRRGHAHHRIQPRVTQEKVDMTQNSRYTDTYSLAPPRLYTTSDDYGDDVEDNEFSSVERNIDGGLKAAFRYLKPSWAVERSGL